VNRERLVVLASPFSFAILVSFLMSDINPYSPSATGLPPVETNRDSAWAKQRLSGPCTALVVMASIHSVLDSIAVVGYLGLDIVGVVVWSSLMLLHILQSIGAAKMGHLESRNLGMFAAVTACIPFASPLFVWGIPFGIWAWRLMLIPDIQRAFESERLKRLSHATRER
jgi:hypothetical protein